MTKVSLIHNKSNEYARADTVTGFRSTTPTVSFRVDSSNRSIPLPAVIGDWYWIVRGGDSLMVELQSVEHKKYTNWYQLHFKR